MPEEAEKLEYIYQHFQDHKKVYESDPQATTGLIPNTLYPQMNNNIEYYNIDYLKMLLIVIIWIVRLGIIFSVLKCVTHMTPQQVQCIQTHPVCTHMIIFHSNSTP